MTAPVRPDVNDDFAKWKAEQDFLKWKAEQSGALSDSTAAVPPKKTAVDTSPVGYGGRRYEPSAARSILSGVTGGLSSKLAGGIDAAIDVATKGADFTDAYVSNVRGMQRAESQYRNANKGTDTALRLAGGVLPATLIGLAGGGPYAAGALLTAGQVAGSTDPTEDFTGSTATKTAIALPLGAAGGKAIDAGVKYVAASPVGELASRGAGWLAGKTSGARQSLLNTVARTTGNRGTVREVIGKSIENTGVSPEQALATLKGAPQSNLPLTLPDIFGGDVRGMAGAVANSPGGPLHVFESALKGRDTESARLLKSVLSQAENKAGAIGSADAVRESIRAEQVKVGKEMYDIAYKSGAAPILDERLQQLVESRPLMGKLMARAAEMAKNEGNPLPTIQVIPPKPPVAADIPDAKWAEMARASGTLSERPVLDVRGLDYVQRALREGMTRGFNGTSVSKQEAASIREGIDGVLKDVAKQFPALQDARTAWSGYAKKLNAMDVGDDLYKVALSTGGRAKSKYSELALNKAVAAMDPEQYDLFRLAARDAALSRAQGGSRSLLGQVRPLIGTERSFQRTATMAGKDAEKVAKGLNDLAEMGRTNNAILGGSQTAPRQMFAEAFNPPSSMVMRDIMARRPSFFAADIASRAAGGAQRTLTQPALLDAANIFTAGARPGTSAVTSLEELVADLNRRELMRRGISGGLLGGGGSVSR